MKLLSLIIVLIFISFGINAQNCLTSEFLTKGSKWEMSNYDKKGKLTGITKYQTISEEKVGNKSTWELKMKLMDEKGDQIMRESSTTISCEDGVFKMDMSEFIPTEAMQSFENMEVEMETTDLDFPSIKDVNSTLKDGTMKVTTFSSGVKIMTINMTITDRKIEGVETIETEAGSFECLKITQNTLVETGIINRTMSSTTWFLPGFGVIKSESFHKNGKSLGVSVLSSMTMP